MKILKIPFYLICFVLTTGYAPVSPLRISCPQKLIQPQSTQWITSQQKEIFILYRAAELIRDPRLVADSKLFESYVKKHLQLDDSSKTETRRLDSKNILGEDDFESYVDLISVIYDVTIVGSAHLRWADLVAETLCLNSLDPLLCSTLVHLSVLFGGYESLEISQEEDFKKSYINILLQHEELHFLNLFNSLKKFPPLTFEAEYQKRLLNMSVHNQSRLLSKTSILKDFKLSATQRPMSHPVLTTPTSAQFKDRLGYRVLLESDILEALRNPNFFMWLPIINLDRYGNSSRLYSLLGKDRILGTVYYNKRPIAYAVSFSLDEALKLTRWLHTLENISESLNLDSYLNSHPLK